MFRRMLPWVAAAGALAALASTSVRADGPRSAYDFESDLQGFNPIRVKDNNFEIDPAGGLSVTNDKTQVKTGAGSLVWSFKPTGGEFHAITADAKLPADTQKVDFWIKCSTQTAYILTLREEKGASYQLPFHVPMHEWTHVSANLTEFTLGDNDKDDDGKLDADQVNNISFFDMANMLVQAPQFSSQPEVAAPRQVWLDDLHFAAGTQPVAFGQVKAGADDAFVVDNFETDIVRWTPARMTLAQPPVLEIFPSDTNLKTLKEAAAPGMARSPIEPGGRGLRYSYKRAGNQLFALFRDLGRVNLAKADRLRLSLRVSQKSLLVVSVKERDGSEYQHPIMPEQSEGWQSLDLALSEMTLGQDSKDENNRLDPDQIKEISILDASGFAGGALPSGDTTMELDAVHFTLKK